jgi:hypothetical protein
VPRHVARLVTRLVAPLVVDYSASCRLVVDYLPPLRVRVALHIARLVTRLVTRLVAPLVVDYFALHRLFIDYFASAARPDASARRAARHAACRATCRRLLR